MPASNVTRMAKCINIGAIADRRAASAEFLDSASLTKKSIWPTILMMELHLTFVLLLGFVAFTTQDISGKKGCDCSICRGVDNRLNPILGKANYGVEKSGCRICEKRKEMLRQEREKQAQRQKCPFDILGGTALKGKASDEIFDEFRELVVPSQNGFFDMMRGVVKTMHGSSVAEMKWAKEKEARELAKKKLEEAKRQKEAKNAEILQQPKPDLNPNPKVTVVVKQTPCGPVLSQDNLLQGKDLTLFKRLPKEARTETFTAPEDESELQMLGPHDPDSMDYLTLDSNENFLDSDLQQFLDYGPWTTLPPEEAAATEWDYGYAEGGSSLETSTESPYVKFMSDKELRALSGGGTLGDDFDMRFDVLPSGSNGVDGNHLVDPVGDTMN